MKEELYFRVCTRAGSARGCNNFSHFSLCAKERGEGKKNERHTFLPLLHQKKKKRRHDFVYPVLVACKGARCMAVPKKRFSLGKAPHLTPHETVIGQLIVPPPLPPKACPIFSRKHSSKKLVEGKEATALFSQIKKPPLHLLLSPSPVQLATTENGGGEGILFLGRN